MKLQSAIDVYVIFIIFIKVVFGISTLADLYLTKISKTKKPELDAKFLFWRQRAEFIFTISVSIILIMVFNPFSKAPLEASFEIKILFFILAIILITGADWGQFIKDTPFLHIK